MFDKKKETFKEIFDNRKETLKEINVREYLMNRFHFNNKHERVLYELLISVYFEKELKKTNKLNSAEKIIGFHSFLCKFNNFLEVESYFFTVSKKYKRKFIESILNDLVVTNNKLANNSLKQIKKSINSVLDNLKYHVEYIYNELNNIGVTDDFHVDIMSVNDSDGGGLFLEVNCYDRSNRSIGSAFRISFMEGILNIFNKVINFGEAHYRAIDFKRLKHDLSIKDWFIKKDKVNGGAVKYTVCKTIDYV